MPRSRKTAAAAAHPKRKPAAAKPAAKAKKPTPTERLAALEDEVRGLRAATGTPPAAATEPKLGRFEQLEEDVRSLKQAVGYKQWEPGA